MGSPQVEEGQGRKWWRDGGHGKQHRDLDATYEPLTDACVAGGSLQVGGTLRVRAPTAIREIFVALQGVEIVPLRDGPDGATQLLKTFLDERRPVALPRDPRGRVPKGKYSFTAIFPIPKEAPPSFYSACSVNYHVIVVEPQYGTVPTRGRPPQVVAGSAVPEAPPEPSAGPFAQPSPQGLRVQLEAPEEVVERDGIHCTATAFTFGTERVRTLAVHLIRLERTKPPAQPHYLEREVSGMTADFRKMPPSEPIPWPLTFDLLPPGNLVPSFRAQLFNVTHAVEARAEDAGGRATARRPIRIRPRE